MYPEISHLHGGPLQVREHCNPAGEPRSSWVRTKFLCPNLSKFLPKHFLLLEIRQRLCSSLYLRLIDKLSVVLLLTELLLNQLWLSYLGNSHIDMMEGFLRGNNQHKKNHILAILFEAIHEFRQGRFLQNPYFRFCSWNITKR